MPILQSVLAEPLLTRQQVAVVRDIARAAQILEALKSLKGIQESFTSNNTSDGTIGLKRSSEIQEYLKAEIMKVLMQIKLPSQPSDTKSSEAHTNTPGKGV